MTVREIIAKNLVTLRKRNKLTQQDVADKLGYSDKTISKWERCDSLPDAEMLFKIAEFYGVTIEYLYTEHPEEETVETKETNDEIDRIIQKKVTIFRLTISITVFLVLAGLVAIFMSLIPINPEINSVFPLILMCISAILLLTIIIEITLKINRYINILLSVCIWTLAVGLYLYFREYNITYIYFVAIVLQILIYVIPKAYSWITNGFPDSKFVKFFKRKNKDLDNKDK